MEFNQLLVSCRIMQPECKLFYLRVLFSNICLWLKCTVFFGSCTSLKLLYAYNMYWSHVSYTWSISSQLWVTFPYGVPISNISGGKIHWLFPLRQFNVKMLCSQALSMNKDVRAAPSVISVSKIKWLITVTVYIQIYTNL